MWSEWCTTWRECACDCVPLWLLPLPLHSACSSLPSCCTAFYGTVGPDHCCCWCSIYLPLPFQNAGRDTRDCRFWSLEQRINCWGTRAASDVVWHAEFFQWFGFYCYVFLFSPLYLSNLFFPPVHPTTITYSPSASCMVELTAQWLSQNISLAMSMLYATLRFAEEEVKEQYRPLVLTFT